MLYTARAALSSTARDTTGRLPAVSAETGSHLHPLPVGGSIIKHSVKVRAVGCLVVLIYLWFKGTGHPSDLKIHYFPPGVLFIYINCFDTSCRVLEISTVEMSAFSQITWN